ncbi:MAG: DoxX family membrane protein [Gemmatimonadales bacterium]
MALILPTGTGMTAARQIARRVFAPGLIALGILGLRYRDFALIWQPVGASIPGRTVLAYASAVLLLFSGIGLLGRRSAPVAERILFGYLVLWLLLLKVPAIMSRPTAEGNWSAFGEIAIIAAGSWVLFAWDPPRRATWSSWMTGWRGQRMATYLFGVAVVLVGLSHFFYHTETASLVPKWLPDRSAWAYLTGIAHIAAGIGVLLGLYARLAATLEAAMITIFTLFVWIPGVVSAPTNRLQWTALTISWVIASGAWVMAVGLAVESSLAVSQPAPEGSAGNRVTEGIPGV